MDRMARQHFAVFSDIRMLGEIVGDRREQGSRHQNEEVVFGAEHPIIEVFDPGAISLFLLLFLLLGHRAHQQFFYLERGQHGLAEALGPEVNIVLDKEHSEHDIQQPKLLNGGQQLADEEERELEGEDRDLGSMEERANQQRQDHVLGEGKHKYLL